MEQSTIIPSELLKSWEEQAIRENIPYTEFAEFIRMKQRRYEESLQPEKESKSLYTDDAKNKLSEYGNKVALAYLLRIPKTKRIIKFARFDFEDLQKQYAKVSKGKADKENFIWDLDHWYKKLKSDMKEYRWSKETLSSYGLDFKAATKFYFAAREIAAGC